MGKSLIPEIARTVVRSPVGNLLLEADAGGLRAIRFMVGTNPRVGALARSGARNVLAEAAHQIEEYFQGSRTRFDLPLAPQGTDFQKAVWEQLLSIPYGNTISYGQLAWRLGRSGAARAIGNACKRNPLPIVIPCHRVIGKDGRLVGYAGGREIKQQLLIHERETTAGPHPRHS